MNSTLPAPSLQDHNTINGLLIGPPILGLVWCAVQWGRVANIKMDGSNAKLELTGGLIEKNQERVDDMKKIAGIIQGGAKDFLFAEYKAMAIYIVVFSCILIFFTNIGTTIAFVLGGCTSILCGYIGMMIAVYTNVRTTYQSWVSLSDGFAVAIQGGSVMGLSLCSIGLLALFGLIMMFKAGVVPFGDDVQMYEAIAGYGLGGSSIALFGRVGGGIYTKAADVGADLSGKNNYGLKEDDARNPACIADNVGDNVGDIAGMGADLFGSFAESTCAALVLAATSNLSNDWASMMYPLLISAVGILVGVVTLLVQNIFYQVKSEDNKTVEASLKGVLVISTVLMTPAVVVLSKVCLPETFELPGGGSTTLQVHWTSCVLSILLGLWSGLIIGYITEYYTSHSYAPVKQIAETQKQSAATGVIMGLALGYLSCVVPTICLGVSILVAHTLCGMFGIALAALGMLGTLTMGLTIDAYGPISDNAGGIAEMSHLPDEVRDRTDCLDAAGNTTAAIGKGFAIGSAALVSLALFGAFTTRAQVTEVDILNPWVFTGLLFGSMMPYAFAAWTMQSVGMAANQMVKECMEQFPKITGKNPDGSPTLDANGNPVPLEEPNYSKCIQISTDASLREMLAPGALVILSPLVAGLGFGKNACAGLLSGALVSSVQLAISMSNTGGAWDNSKKYISAGGDGTDEHRKGSEAHSNSVTGDTVGDPLKDTSGPALNIVMKLTAIMSLVFGTAIKEYSNSEGGPFWLH